MTYRIAAIGAGKDMLASLRNSLGPEAARLVSLADGDPLPLDAVAAIGPPRSAAALAAAGAVLGARQEALLALTAQSIDAREGIPLENAPRIAGVARRFAETLGLDTEGANRFVCGALLHDIGKLQIPNDVLLSNALLTHDQWALLRRHTVLGAAYVAAIPDFAGLAGLVRSHHENVDGTGYPDGLEGDAIPPLARAMRIVDVYCAMTGPRHYRKGMASKEEALAHIRSQAGAHFDAAMAAVFPDAAA